MDHRKKEMLMNVKINLLSFGFGFLVLIFGSHFFALHAEPFKILHLSFHQGCIEDFAAVAKEFHLDLTSWYITESHESIIQFYEKELDFDIYNIDHAYAERVWKKFRHYFNTFDAIITSDTAPLSRIFIQNDWQKPLIIWVCNRFDFNTLEGTQDSHFPDPEYYALMQKATIMPNVSIICYTPYEIAYAQSKNVPFPNSVIRPSGLSGYKRQKGAGNFIPAGVNKAVTLFLAPNFYEKSHLKYVTKKCREHGITIFYGQYNGPDELAGFKGIVHFPYQASLLSLFENMHRGQIYFVPSAKFIENMVRKDSEAFPHFWKPGQPYTILGSPVLEHCEFYRVEHKDLFVFFDSWQDLKEKIETTDYEQMRERVKQFAVKHTQTTLDQWRKLFSYLQ